MSSLTRAAANIVNRSLALRRNQNLIIFADSDSLDFAELIGRAAREVGGHTSILFVPQSTQRAFDPHERLPLPMEAAIREADVILICLSDRPEHSPIRRSVLHTSWNRRTKVVHAPGMRLDYLPLADTDYHQIHEQCQTLALAFIVGRQIEIVTADSGGREYRLLVESGGWDPAPIISDGIVREGSWANLPPGETFIIPQDGHGQIVINGSLPGRVLAPGEEIILTFQDGCLSGIQPEDSPAARHLFETQIAYAQGRQDANWSNLAELGLGVNPAVNGFTGSALVDTKKAGTLHVALGHSASMGGEVDSVIHCDLVTERPTVLVDGRPLLEAGRWSVNAADWHPDHESVAVPADWWEQITVVCRSGARAEQNDGHLVRLWNSGPGRWDSLPVGTEPTARLAAALYQLIPDRGEMLTRERLLARAKAKGVSAAAVRSLLWILHQYDLVRLPGEPG